MELIGHYRHVKQVTTNSGFVIADGTRGRHFYTDGSGDVAVVTLWN